MGGSNPRGSGAADAGARPLQRRAERRDVSHADAVPCRHPARGAGADRRLHRGRQAVRRRQSGRAVELGVRDRQSRLRAVRRQRGARARPALRACDHHDGARHRLDREHRLPARLMFSRARARAGKADQSGRHLSAATAKRRRAPSMWAVKPSVPNNAVIARSRTLSPPA